MEPGSISDLGMSDKLVFRAKFTSAMPTPAQRYWRGPVFAYTDGKLWSKANSRSFEQQLAKPRFSGQAHEYTLLMEPRDKNWLYALDLPSQLPKPLFQNAYYQVLSMDNPDKRSEYKLISYPSYNTGALSDAERSVNLQLPAKPSEKINDFVKQLQGFSKPPQVFINNILQHFRTEDFHYTLTPPLMEENPIETFLFTTRYGFCSHYSAAFVYLMRVAGIPARVVTGYQGGEYNKVGDFLEIREADAHAWAEVWLVHQGWVRVDPTAAVAPERVEKNLDLEELVPGGIIRFSNDSDVHSGAYQWLKQATQLWSHVDYNWQRWVINYNTKNQAQFLASLGIFDLKTMLYGLLVSLFVLTCLLSWVLLRQQRAKPDRLLLAYQRYCRKLAKCGLHRNPAEGELSFAERAKQQLPEHAEAIQQITALYLKLRYGKQSSTQDWILLTNKINVFSLRSFKVKSSSING